MGLRPLGTSGLRVGPVGLGTVKFGRNRGVKYPQTFDLPDRAAIARLLAAAAELGINLLDTAPAYGTAEERLGEALAGQRERWLIAGKAGEEFDGERSRFDFSPPALRASVERSLRRLRTDRLDILLLHSDGQAETAARFGPAFALLDQLKREGLIRASGFSGKTVAGGLLALDHVDVVMVTMNTADLTQRPVIAAAHNAGKGVLIKKALASGQGPAAGGVDAVAAAMQLIFAEPGVSAVVVGSLSIEHLTADVRAADAAIAG